MSPDVIVMDLNLPELDGWEAARCLKAKFPDQAVLFRRPGRRDPPRAARMAPPPLSPAFE